MATGSDQAVGYSLVAFACAVFSYYTIWVVILPFVDPTHAIHSYFLPRHFAIILPVVAGVIVLSAVAAFFTVITIRSKKAKQKSS